MGTWLSRKNCEMALKQYMLTNNIPRLPSLGQMYKKTTLRNYWICKLPVRLSWSFAKSHRHNFCDVFHKEVVRFRFNKWQGDVQSTHLNSIDIWWDEWERSGRPGNTEADWSNERVCRLTQLLNGYVDESLENSLAFHQRLRDADTSTPTNNRHHCQQPQHPQCHHH